MSLMASVFGRELLPRAMASASGSDCHEVRTSHLLAALISDEAVRMMLADRGVSPTAIGAMLGVPIPRTVNPDDHVAFGAEALSVLDEAERIASAGEHSRVEPGHVLLAIMRVPASDAARALTSLGGDLDLLAGDIARQLPTVRIDPDTYRTEAKQYSRLRDDEVERLLSELVEWQNALEVLRRARQPDKPCNLEPSARNALRERALSHAPAWMALRNHHLYLAVAAADGYTARGHDFGFVYRIASNALLHVCLKYDGEPTTAAFITTVTQTIATELERATKRAAGEGD